MNQSFIGVFGSPLAFVNEVTLERTHTDCFDLDTFPSCSTEMDTCAGEEVENDLAFSSLWHVLA